MNNPVQLPPTHTALLAAFRTYLTTLGLSSISCKLYSADVSRLLSSSIFSDLSLTTLTTTKNYLSYLAQPELASSPTLLRRSLASLKQFGLFLSHQYELKNPLTNLTLASSPTTNPLSINSNKYIKACMEYLKDNHLTDASIRSYKSDITQYLTYLESHYPSTHIESLLSEKNIQNYADMLAHLDTQSEATIERKIKTIKRFMQWFRDSKLKVIVSDNTKLTASSTARSIMSIPVQDTYTNAMESVESDSLAVTHTPDQIHKFVKINNYRKFRLPTLRTILSGIILLTLISSLSILTYRQFGRDATLTAAFPSTPVTPNRQLSFQGRLENASGTPITASTNFVFKLFDASSGGTELYSSGTCSITPDTDGVFSTQIGGTCGSGISSNVFTENSDVWLEVTVAAETLTPRQQIATVAYALNSETIQGFPISATVSAIRNTVVPMNQWGEIIVGEQSPRLTGVSGTFQISAPSLSLVTATGTNGNITLAPDGTGQVNLNGNTTTTNFFNVSNAQLTTGSLITGTAANNNSGFNLINLFSGSSPTSKFRVDNAGNTTIAGDLTITGDDLFMNTNTTGYILVADGTNYNPVAMSGDITINSSGVTAIGSDKITESMLKSVNAPTDELCLSYESTVGDFEWQTCGGGGSGSNWRFNLGTLSPINDTVDLLVGGNATSSAKFAVLNVNSGTPTASVSAGIAGSSYLTANGTLATTAKQSLTLGNSTTGNVIIAPGGTTALTAISNNLTAANNLTLTASSNLIFGSTNLGESTSAIDSGAYVVGVFDEFTNSSSSNVQAVLNDLDDAITSAASGAGLWTDSGTVTYLTSTTDDLAIGGTAVTNSIFGIDESAGNFYLGSDNTANPTLNFESTNSNGGEFGFNTNDAFFFSNASVGIGTVNPATKLEVADGALTLTNDWNLRFGNTADVRVQGSNAGGANYLTLITGGTDRIRINNSGDVGIGTTGQDAKLDVLTTSGEQLRLSYADGTSYTGFTTSSTGDLTITPSGGDLAVTANATVSGNTTMGGQLQLGRFGATPTAIGAGTMIFDTTNNVFKCYDGATWYNCGGTLFSNTNASVADGSYITVAHNLATNDLLSSAWINAQGVWKSLDATYRPAIAWEGKDTQKGIYHNQVNSYTPQEETGTGTSTLQDGLIFDTFEDATKADSANTTVSSNAQLGDDGSSNYVSLNQRVQSGRAGLIGGQTLSTSTTDNDTHTYLGSNTVTDMYYYDRSKDSTPEVLVELGIDPNWYNGVTLSVATTSAQYSQTGTIATKNPNLTTSYNGSLIKASGTDSTPRTIYITIKSPTTFDWTNYQGDAATGVTITPGTAQTLGSTGVSATFTAANYNVGDVFKIASWFIEGESSTRGAKQQFPERSYVVANASGVDVIDADTQKLWIRFSLGVNYNMGQSTVTATHALNGSVYGTSVNGLRQARFVEDMGYSVQSTGTYRIQPISMRNADNGYITQNTTTTILNSTANDVSASVVCSGNSTDGGDERANKCVTPVMLLAVASDSGLSVINETNSRSLAYSDATDNDYNSVVITKGGELYGLNETLAQAEKWNNVHSDTANETNGTPDKVWDESSIPALSSSAPTIQTIPSTLNVTYKTSTANQSSDTIFIGTNLGTTVIQDYAGSETSGSVKYYTKDYISEEMIGDIRGMWPMNNSNTASDFEDVSVKANTLTGNNITANGDSVSGVRGTATDLNGTNEYLYRANDSDFDLTNAITLGSWIKTSTTGQNQVILLRVGSTGASCAAPGSVSTNAIYELYIDSTNVIKIGVRDNTDGTLQFLTGTKTVTDGQWHHVVGVIDKTSALLSIYIDGKLDSSTPLTETGTYTFDDGFYVGAYCDNTSTTSLYFSGYLDESFITGTALNSTTILNMYQVGYRALQSHGTGLGGGAADANQQLGYISTGTNSVGVVAPDFNNQYMYVGLNSTTLGGLSKIQLNSDTNIKTYNSSANVPSGGVLLLDEDITSLAVGETLYAVGSATSGVKTMGLDNNATATSGNFVSKTYTLPKNIGSAVLWVSPIIDGSDGSNTLTVKASNDGGSSYATCTLVNTNSNATVPENEYACTFSAADNDLKVKFEFVRGSAKTNTYITQYGISWLGETGFRVEQVDSNNTRLYNFSGETQNLKLNVTGASTTNLANPWTDAGSYLYPTGYETIRIYDGAGSNYLALSDTYINFGATSGSSGYGIRDNAGTMEFKNSAGTWTALGTGGASWWDQVSGTIQPYNNTVDLLLGGTATTSAKIALINIGSGTPTASVSAGVAGGIYMNATGTIATTAKQTLSLGDSTTTGNIILQGGNVGIGVTNPTQKLEVNGYVVGQRFEDSASSAYYLDPAATGTSLSIDGNIVGNGAFYLSTGNDATAVSIGTTGAGKLDAGTIDPPYTINGEKFATYMSGMTGVKEETTGTVNTTEFVSGKGYRATLDFANALKGSDLWLFSQTTRLQAQLENLIVLTTALGNGRTWYEMDASSGKLYLYSQSPTRVSYRLTAPRFDAETWTNTRESDSLGFVVDNPTSWSVSNFATNLYNQISDTVSHTITSLLSTNTISPLADGTDITITAPVKIISSTNNPDLPTLIVDGEIQATTISARLAQLESIQTENLTAKNIVADTISANHIEGLDAKIASLSAGLSDNEISSITDRIKARLTDLTNPATASDIPVPNDNPEEEIADILSIPNISATSSATIASADIDFATINSYLAVVGSATITDLSITNNLYASSINSQNGVLTLQSNGGLINLGSNTLIVDSTGSVVVNGDLYVNGRVLAQSASINNLELGSAPSATTSSALGNLLAVYNENGETVATIDASGSANLASLTTNMITIASAGSATDSSALATLSGTTKSNSTAGNASLQSPSTELVIESPYVTPDSLVYLTPTTNTDNKVLFVKSKESCTLTSSSCKPSFTVGIDAPANSDISFNWWIIELKPTQTNL